MPFDGVKERICCQSGEVSSEDSLFLRFADYELCACLASEVDQNWRYQLPLKSKMTVLLGLDNLVKWDCLALQDWPIPTNRRMFDLEKVFHPGS